MIFQDLSSTPGAARVGHAHLQRQEVGMAEIRGVVRRWMGGQGHRAIARATGLDRKTQAKYVHKAGT